MNERKKSGTIQTELIFFSIKWYVKGNIILLYDLEKSVIRLDKSHFLNA